MEESTGFIDWRELRVNGSDTVHTRYTCGATSFRERRLGVLRPSSPSFAKEGAIRRWRVILLFCIPFRFRV